MILVQPWLGVDPTKPTWKVLLWVSQLGAILAVIVCFWRELWTLTFRPARKDWRSHIVPKLLAAMAPTIVLALLLHDWFEANLENPVGIGVALLVGAALMWWIDRAYRKSGDQTIEDISLTQAALIGVAQSVSMWPGISRSGASIMGGMMAGLTPRVATEFSFYLAIPTMLAASAKTLWDYRNLLSTDSVALVVVGTGVSFAVALLVVSALLEFVKRYRFTVFVIYRVILGVAVLLFSR